MVSWTFDFRRIFGSFEPGSLSTLFQKSGLKNLNIWDPPPCRRGHMRGSRLGGKPIGGVLFCRLQIMRLNGEGFNIEAEATCTTRARHKPGILCSGSILFLAFGFA